MAKIIKLKQNQMKAKLERKRSKIQQDNGKRTTILMLKYKRMNYIKPFRIYTNRETDIN
jgi:hypothetical protein